MRDSFRALRQMPGAFRAVPALLAVLVIGCGPSEDAGFEKVTTRERTGIPAAAAPEPPPPVAGIAGEEAVTTVDFAAVSFPAGVTPQMAEQGQELYATVCVACHGAGGQGSPIAPALNNNEWLNVTGEFPEIVTVIKNGVPSPRQYPAAMPPMGGGSFTDEQVRAIAAYVYALNHRAGV